MNINWYIDVDSDAGMSQFDGSLQEGIMREIIFRVFIILSG